MAPEIIHGHEYDFKVDMWSLGVIFYEIVTGDKAKDARFDSVKTETEVSEKLSSNPPSSSNGRLRLNSSILPSDHSNSQVLMLW